MTDEAQTEPSVSIKPVLLNASIIRYASALVAAIIWLVLVCEHMTPVQPFVNFLELLLSGVGLVHSVSTLAGK